MDDDEAFPMIPGTGFIDIESMITDESRKMFEAAKKQFSDEFELAPEHVKMIKDEGKKNNKTPVFPFSIMFLSGKLVISDYGSPFPEQLLHLKTVNVCDYCLRFFLTRDDLKKHSDSQRGCYPFPPGVEIYRQGSLSVFEIDGNRQKGYCRNLCLISRLFLESKTISIDTEHFMFYVLVFRDEETGIQQFVGYFSREMYWPPSFSMMCLMVLSTFQGKGYGKLLIGLSYAMARQQKLQLGPETPLSDSGKIAHEQYWLWAICNAHVELKDTVPPLKAKWSMREIAESTGISSLDVKTTFDHMIEIQAVIEVEEKEKGLKTWRVDWEGVRAFLNSEKEKVEKGLKVQFDESCFDWQPQRITPQMNGFIDDSNQKTGKVTSRRRQKKNYHETALQMSELPSNEPSTSGPWRDPDALDEESERAVVPKAPRKKKKKGNWTHRKSQRKIIKKSPTELWESLAKTSISSGYPTSTDEFNRMNSSNRRKQVSFAPDEPSTSGPWRDPDDDEGESE